MRIGFFSTYFPYKEPFSKKVDKRYFWGGEGEAAYHLAVNLMERGHSVRVFTSAADSVNSIERYKNITIHRYAKSFKIFNTCFSLGLLHSPSKYDVDIVHAHFATPPAPLGAMMYHMRSRKKKPFVVTIHQIHNRYAGASYGSVVRYASLLFYKRFVANTILKQADCILAPSKEYVDQSDILQKYADRVKIIPIGMDPEEFTIGLSKSDCRARLGLSDNELVILNVGTLSEQKGLDVLLKAFLTVRRRIPNVRLVLVGPLLARSREILDLTRKLHADSVVDFTGVKYGYEKNLYFASADLFVSASYDESWGLSVCEAMACGLPVIVSDLEVFRSIIADKQNGFLAKRGNYQDFANKIIYALENDAIRKRAGGLAREKVKEFSWKKVAAETEQVYLTLLDLTKS